MTQTQDKRTAALLRRQRYWPDLRRGRLCIGLALGPMVTAALLAGFASLDKATPETEAILGSAVLLVLGIGWSLFAGWAYLLVITRRRGRITRRECLLLGIAISLLLPMVFLMLFTATLGIAETERVLTSSDAPVAAAIGILVTLALSGWLGGWLFWRIGVRPGRIPNLAPVFD
jgi:hypothetical protein